MTNIRYAVDIIYNSCFNYKLFQVYAPDKFLSLNEQYVGDIFTNNTPNHLDDKSIVESIVT